ncbi:hypothetical protein GF420_09510 [candidate division GN15 bacterium]|nr:hypothetical protein [candidate division GN15 bacterium]
MAKRRQAAPARKRASRTGSFEPHRSRYFTLIAFAILAVTLLMLFGEFVFSDKMLYGSDVIQAGIFFRGFYVDFWHTHGWFTVPQWNPYIFGGLPFIEAFHGDIFYPFSKMKNIEWFFPWWKWLGLELLYHIFFAGLFMYLCARRFGLSKIPSLFAACSYMYAGYLISLVAPGHDGKIFVTTLFPLVVMFLHMGYARDPVHWRTRWFDLRWSPLLCFTMVGLVIGLILLSPHAQMAYFTLWVVALYSGFRLILLWFDHRSIRPLIKPAVLTTFAVVVGIFISAIQFYPGYIYTKQFSPRAADDSKSGWDWATSWSLHEEEAMGLLIPEFPGANLHGSQESIYWGKNAFKDNAETIPITGLFVAIIGLFFARNRERWFFGGLALFAFTYALGATTPLFRLYYLIPNVSSLRAPSMIMFLFSFSAALLAAMGLQALINRRQGEEKDVSPVSERRLSAYQLVVPAVFLLLALAFSGAGESMLRIWSSLFYDNVTSPLPQGYSKWDLAMANLSAIQSGAWFSFLAVALASAGLWLYRRGQAGRWILLGLCAIVVLNGMRFNSRFIGTIDFERVARKTPVIQFLEQQEGVFRTMDITDPQSNRYPQYGFPVPYGYHGNQLRWFDQLAGGPARTSQFNPRFLNLVGSSWIVTPSNQRIPEGALGPEPLTVAATFGQHTVVRNENALPRAFLADRYEIYPDREDIYPIVLRGNTDLRRTVLLEKEPELEIQADTTAAGRAVISEYNLDSIVVSVTSARNQLLVLTDTWYDAWHAEIDRRPAEVLRSYGAFRAVAVPAGVSQVVFRFESSRYTIGQWVTWLTTLLVLGIIIGHGVIAARGKTEQVEDET